MSNIKEIELNIVKFIDYIYLDNFVANTLMIDENILLSKKIKNKYDENSDENWEIFSSVNININFDETINILYFIKKIKSHKNYNYDILLLSIHIYSKICKKYAHLIDNYTYLFASVYIVVNNVINNEYLTYIYMIQILNITNNIATKMINIVNKFIDSNDIYFDLKEKEWLKNKIICK